MAFDDGHGRVEPLSRPQWIRCRRRRLGPSDRVRTGDERRVEDGAAPRPLLARALERPNLSHRLRGRSALHVLPRPANGKSALAPAGSSSARRKIDRRNSPASPTPVTDGEAVYVFFGDFGLLSYGADGTERWRFPLGPFDNAYGMGSSPSSWTTWSFSSAIRRTAPS